MKNATLLATLAALALTVVAPASAHPGAPFHVEKWANVKLRTVHQWRGYKVEYQGGIMGCSGSDLVDRFDRNGESIYRHFICTLVTPSWDHVFHVTLHTTGASPYFRLTAGW